MGKLIVMHHHPDLDAVGAGWLLTRFLANEFRDASFAFVPAGQTYRNQVVDINPDVVHVDTGGGRFDHHDAKRTELSASLLVYQYVLSKQEALAEDEALAILVDFINEIDHFGEYYWPEASNPRYAFMLSNIIPALHALNRFDNEKVVELSFIYLDAVYQYLKDWVRSKRAVEEGEKFDSIWGKGVVLEVGLDNAMKVAQVMGYKIVVRQDPRTHFTKIKSVPEKGINLKKLYDKIVQLEDTGRWYFHPSGHMLINGSSKNRSVKPTKLTTNQIVKMIKDIK